MENKRSMKTTLGKLSGIEQKVYFFFEERNQRVITLEEVTKCFHISKQYASKIMHELSRKNACERVKGGLYVRFPASIVINKGAYQEDPILLARALNNNYFFSYYTALSLHGLAHRIIRTYYLTSTEDSGKRSYHGNIIQIVKLIPSRFFGFIAKEYSGQKIFVSDLERTIIDVIDRSKYAGGWQEIIQCLSDLRGVNWNKMLTYIKRFNTKSLIQRAGYIFETLKSSLSVPDNFIKNLHKEISSNIYYFGKDVGRFNSKWNVIVSPDLIKE